VSLALTEDHKALSEVARAFLDDKGALAAAHASLSGDGGGTPVYWDELCGMGWTGLHLPEDFGGQGYGLLELAIVVEELGRVVSPGPFLPTAIASATIDRCGSDDHRAALLPLLAAGSTIAAVAFIADVIRDGDKVSGTASAVLGGADADWLLLPSGKDLVVVAAGDGVVVTPCDGMDKTRSLANVALDGAPVAHVLAGAIGTAELIAKVLVSAEATGGARAATEMAVEYAKVREQFGRTIGTFQAVKHHAANMLVDVELANASTWEAVEQIDDPNAALAAGVATTRALPGFQRCAQKNIQLHGGIGFTWEHPAHVYLRRAATLSVLFGGDAAAGHVFDLTAGGASLDHSVELPPEAERYRSEVRTFRADFDALPGDEKQAALVESGYFMPHWPKPLGRGAGPIEQLVIEEELAGIPKAQLGIGGWVLLTVSQHGTPDQLERWMKPGLLGEEHWCQLFSEPDAGSDAAGIKTRAVRVEGGWMVNGQKVWTSGAQNCQMGLATVRTNPDAPKHAGVSTMAIDLRDEAVEIRPITEITGQQMFNEVFFNDLFVPDDDVVGEIDQGWTVARATLGNERVSIGGNAEGPGGASASALVPLAQEQAPGDRGAASRVGEALAENHAMRSLNVRNVMRALIGGPPGPEGNITKLLSAEHAQRVAETALSLTGPAAVTGGDAAVGYSYLFTRCLTIAGGTSEIVRNVIAERLLGLPRDPLIN